MEQNAFVVLGPTASGKTAYAIDLARRVGGAVISADSRQVYAGMNIGTAKPKEAWSTAVHPVTVPDGIDGIPHYMINITSPDTPYTLSEYLAGAKQAMAKVASQGLVPVIAGGTMLYVDALVDGYNIPDVAPNEALRSELEQHSPEALYAMLLAKDPSAQAFIEPHNTRRIIRALEVFQATGKPFSELRAKQPSDTVFHIIGLFPDWDILRERITQRAQEMIDSGLQEEIQTLQRAFPNSKLLQTMNYKENCNVEKMVQSNMRYAHRQMSWWKRRDDIYWIC